MLKHLGRSLPRKGHCLSLLGEDGRQGRWIESLQATALLREPLKALPNFRLLSLDFLTAGLQGATLRLGSGQRDPCLCEAGLEGLEMGSLGLKCLPLLVNLLQEPLAGGAPVRENALRIGECLLNQCLLCCQTLDGQQEDLPGGHRLVFGMLVAPIHRLLTGDLCVDLIELRLS